MAEPALRLQTAGSLRLRNVSEDAVVLATLQRGAIVIADIGDSLERLAPERLLRRFGQLIKLARIVAVVDHLACDDQLVLVVHGDLHVVARNRLAVLRQQPGVGVRARQLCLAAVLEPAERGLRLRTLRHQRRHLLRNVAAVAAIIPFG